MNNVPSELSHNSFVVKFYKPSSRICCRNFIAKIIIRPDSDNDYKVVFLKRSSKVKSGFVVPDVEVLASISYSDIIFLLQTPFPVAETARLSKDLGLMTIYRGNLDITLLSNKIFLDLLQYCTKFRIMYAQKLLIFLHWLNRAVKNTLSVK